MNHKQLLEENLGLIDQVVRYIARRHHLSAHDQDDFRQLVHLKLVERDYAILRKFEGRSSLATFLTTVVSRILLDQRIALWGKWRPSAAARRLGPVAILLEKLISREGMTFDAALEALRSNHQVTESDAELAEMRRWLSVRAPRREAGDEELATIPASDPPLDKGLDAAERATLAGKLQLAMGEVFDTLDPQDALILKMRFVDDFQISTIARTLGLEQKPLYRRIDQLLQRLCVALQARGLSREDVLSLIGASDVDLGPVLERRAAGIREVGPSMPMNARLGPPPGTGGRDA